MYVKLKNAAAAAADIVARRSNGNNGNSRRQQSVQSGNSVSGFSSGDYELPSDGQDEEDYISWSGYKGMMTFNNNNNNQANNNNNNNNNNTGMISKNDNNNNSSSNTTIRENYGFTNIPIEEKEFNNSLSYSEKLGKQRNQWTNYLKLQQDRMIERNATLKQLVRLGIPPELRGRIWCQLVDIKRRKMAAEEKEQYASNYSQKSQTYRSILHDHKDEFIPDIKAIDKDLRRTFQNHVAFEKEEGLGALRRVLVAYAFKNRDVGYVQSMNFVVALLLLFMDEEDAFWMLSVIVEEILSGYYTSDLYGAIVDQHVLRLLVSERLPKVGQHLEKFGIDIAIMTLPWFLAVFVTSLPLEITLRVWDCLFYEGSKIMFRIALSLLKLNEKQILNTKDPGELFLLLDSLPRSIINPDAVFKVAFSLTFLGSFGIARIVDLRDYYGTIVREDLRIAQLKNEELEKSLAKDEAARLERKNAATPPSSSTPVESPIILTTSLTATSTIENKSNKNKSNDADDDDDDDDDDDYWQVVPDRVSIISSNESITSWRRTQAAMSAVLGNATIVTDAGSVTNVTEAEKEEMKKTLQLLDPSRSTRFLHMSMFVSNTNLFSSPAAATSSAKKSQILSTSASTSQQQEQQKSNNNNNNNNNDKITAVTSNNSSNNSAQITKSQGLMTKFIVNSSNNNNNNNSKQTAAATTAVISIKSLNEVHRNQLGVEDVDTTSLIEREREFLEGYELRLNKNRGNWKQYISKLNDNLNLIEKNAQLKSLVRQGIPPEYRGRIWCVLMNVNNKYKNLYKYKDVMSEIAGLDSKFVSEIDRDLMWAFPEGKVYNSELGFGALRRVLVAFFHKFNQYVYVQASCFITAVLLMYMTEEDSFFMLAAIAENIQKGYYHINSNSDDGMANIDQKVLQQLIQSKLSKIGNHCLKYDVDTNHLCLSWFLSLFATSLPLETCSRVWDCIFYDGDKALFRIALALLRINEKRILLITDTGELHKAIKQLPKGCIDCDELIKTAYDPLWMTAFKHQQIDDLRKQFST